MDTQTARALCMLNNEFYENNAASFSETRSAPWSGWKRCLDSTRKILGTSHKLSNSGVSENGGLKVFDLASGNFRFENFLSARLPDATISFYTVDNCSDFVRHPANSAGDSDDFTPLTIQHQNLDVLALLQEGSNPTERFMAPLCDISVSFGFMHHVPTFAYRKAVLECLIQQTQPGGVVLVSFWQFMNNDELSKKAVATHEKALRELGLPSLDENDYILGWQDIAGAYRYCHSFTDEEIDELILALGTKATVVSRFTSDGRTDDLNSYVVLQVSQTGS